MAKVPLSALTLNLLSDGFAGRAIDNGLRHVQDDITNRGNDGLPRTVTIKVTLTPDHDARCEIDVDVSTKVPGFKPPKTVAKYDQNAGGLMFSPDCSENPDQKTIHDLEGAE